MKKRIWLSAAVILSAGIIHYKRNYHAWQRAQAMHLKEGSKLINTASGSVEYSTSGSGPGVLISHGSPGGYDMGLAFADLLDTSQFTYIAPSRPGYLRTPLETGPSPEEQADMYAALLDTLGMKQVAIIGISGGGPSAIQFALRHPERCSSLVSISGVTQYYSEQDIWQALPPIQRRIKQGINTLSSSDFVLYTIILLTQIHPKNAVAAALVRTATHYAQRKIGYNNDMEQFLKISRYPLQNITVPTFIVHGINDDEVFFADAQLLASEAPQAKLLALPDAKHMAFYTHAHLVMPALRDFLLQTTKDPEVTK